MMANFQLIVMCIYNVCVGIVCRYLRTIRETNKGKIESRAREIVRKRQQQIDSEDSVKFTFRRNPCVRDWTVFSEEGYYPHNPEKSNQDSYKIATDSETGAILFSVFDGHGTAGDLVSQYCRDNVAQLCFGDKAFPSNIPAVLTDMNIRLDKDTVTGMLDICMLPSLASTGTYRQYLGADAEIDMLKVPTNCVPTRSSHG